MEFYALVDEAKPTEFLVRAKTIGTLERKIELAYQARRSMRPKGAIYELSDYLSGKKKVKVTIEEIS